MDDCHVCIAIASGASIKNPLRDRDAAPHPLHRGNFSVEIDDEATISEGIDDKVESELKKAPV